MQKKRHVKNAFGVKIRTFAMTNGIDLQTLAERAGVNYYTMLSASTGRTPGEELKETVLAYIAQQEGRKGKVEPS